MPFAELTAGRFYYEDSGTGEPVVFSHGFLMDHEMFAPQVEALAGSYRCIVWDERGHGRTEADPRWSYWDGADDLLALLDHLGIETAFLVAMSQGGFISLRAALKAPARVRGLVLIDTQAGLEDPELIPAYDAMIEQWTSQGPSRDLAEITASILLGPGTDHEPWIARWMERDPAEMKPIYRTLMSRDDITERLSEIESPALVMHGSEDVAIALERAHALADGLPRAGDVLEIPGAGHAANLGDPVTANEAIASFLKEHS